MSNVKFEHVIIGGQRMLIAYTTFKERLEEIKIRQDAHDAILESQRQIDLIKKVL